MSAQRDQSSGNTRGVPSDQIIHAIDVCLETQRKLDERQEELDSLEAQISLLTHRLGPPAPWWRRPATRSETHYWLLGFVTGLYVAWPKGRRS